MPCATRGPAHKLCRSLLIARTRKGIHSYAPLPRFPMHTATHRTPLPPNLKGQEGNALGLAPRPPPLPISQRTKAMSLTPDLEGPGREGIHLRTQTAALPAADCIGQCYTVSSEAEKASASYTVSLEAEAMLHCLLGGGESLGNVTRSRKMKR